MFAIHGHLLPRIHSYAEALKAVEEAQPSTHKTGWKALSSKRDATKTFKKDDDESVVFCFHTTNLVRWYKSGAVQIELHDSVSSRIFIDRFLPPTLHTVCIGGDSYISNRQGVFRSGKPLLFMHQPESYTWALQNPAQCVIHHQYTLDKKKAVQTRKKLKDWIDWRNAMKRLTGDRAYRQEIGASSMYAGFVALKEMLKGVKLPYTELNKMGLMHSTTLLREAYILDGAVTISVMPLGSRPQKSTYEDSMAWGHV